MDRCNWLCAAAISFLIAPLGHAGEVLPQVNVTLTQHCLLQALQTSAGKVQFVITNQSHHPMGWAIFDNKQLVDLQDDIASGQTQSMIVDLEPGHYTTRCLLPTEKQGQLTAQAVAKVTQYQLSVHDIEKMVTDYQAYLVSQGQQAEQLASQWQGGDVALNFAVSYYSLLPFATAFNALPSEDRLGGKADDIGALRAQINQFKTVTTTQQLPLSVLIMQLQKNLTQPAQGGARWLGLMQDTRKLVDIVTPVVAKLSQSTVAAAESNLATWKKGDNPDIRQQIRADLAHIANQLKLADTN
ncbi:cupredoxin domain-containing protein [Celerinatantimonas yamalensis]|uniref:Cupredoxin domain-containing protein n=1 Tax=Celerinatantimonas yamalensis TaxID=559956 RepID=A0ABW9G6J2_9GAMM